MAKVIGKIRKLKKSTEPVYMVKRKNRTNSLDCVTLREFGQSFRADCLGTCDILNDSPDNAELKKNKNFSGRKYFFFPTMLTV